MKEQPKSFHMMQSHLENFHSIYAKDQAEVKHWIFGHLILKSLPWSCLLSNQTKTWGQLRFPSKQKFASIFRLYSQANIYEVLVQQKLQRQPLKS